jgi:dihydrofolate reductase
MRVPGLPRRPTSSFTASSFTASSVDGFVADPEDSLSWLLTRDVDVHGPMGYQAFLDQSVGALAMGSTTYRWILGHELAGGPSRDWPYALPTWVFSTQELPRAQGDLRVVRGDVAAHHPDMLAAAGDRGVWVVGGGELAGQFADAGLLDELWVQWAPVALGAGAPLLPRRVELRLEDVVRNGDFACARYTVLPPVAGAQP